jgi:hypothetical protein
LPWETNISKFVDAFVDGSIGLFNILSNAWGHIWRFIQWSFKNFLKFVAGFLNPYWQIAIVTVFLLAVLVFVTTQYGDTGVYWLGKIKAGSKTVVNPFSAWWIGLGVGLVINTFQMLPHLGKLFTSYARVFAAVENDMLEENFSTYAAKIKSPLGFSIHILRGVSYAFFAFELVVSSSYAWAIKILTLGPVGLLVGGGYIFIMVAGPFLALMICIHAINLIATLADEP